MFGWILLYFLTAFWWSTAVLWLAAIFWTRRELKFLRPLEPTCDFFSINSEPAVSVLLPARNEEKRILSDCINSLLDQDYRNLEIIAVNDRSTDGTAEILNDLQSKHRRLQIVRGAELPAGWLGKPFALQQGLSKARGEWVLTTDADIIFDSDTVSTALRFAVENRLDALCLIPFVECETFWERVFIPTFNWFRMLRMPPSQVNNQQKSNTMGIGNFFLIKKTALDKINAFNIVRGDVAEDLRLAQKLKQSNFRIETHNAPDLLKTRMYAGVQEIWHGFTKNFFAGADFSLVSAVSGVGSILLLGVVPFASLVAVGASLIFDRQNSLSWLLPPLVLIYILQVWLFAMLCREYKQPRWYALFAAFGLTLFAAILTNSTIKVLSGSGVVWKDRQIYKRGETARTMEISK